MVLLIIAFSSVLLWTWIQRIISNQIYLLMWRLFWISQFKLYTKYYQRSSFIQFFPSFDFLSPYKSKNIHFKQIKLQMFRLPKNARVYSRFGILYKKCEKEIWILTSKPLYARSDSNSLKHCFSQLWFCIFWVKFIKNSFKILEWTRLLEKKYWNWNFWKNILLKKHFWIFKRVFFPITYIVWTGSFDITIKR